ncbi:Vitamin K epoxide reductase family protein [compost metagenome]
MALAVIPMGLASLGLILLQAFVFREFCTLCLASAALSLSLVPLAWPEIHATWRCWRRRRVDKREI